MGLSRFYFCDFDFFIVTLFILNCFAEQLPFKRTEQNDRRVKLASKSQKDFTQNVEKAAKWVTRKKVRRSKKKGAL